MAVSAAALVCMVVAAAGWWNSLGWPVVGWTAAGAVAVFAAQAEWTFLRFRGFRTEALSHDEVLFPFLLVFAGPTVAVLATLVGTIATNLLARRTPLKALFNVAQFTVAAGTGAGLAVVVGGEPESVRFILGVSAAVVSFAVVEIGVFSGLMATLNRKPWLEMLNEDLREDGPRYAAEVLLGTSGALAVHALPAIAPVVALTVVVLLAAQHRWLAIIRDQERLGDLLSVTAELHGAVTVDEAQRSLGLAIHLMTGADVSFGPDDAPKADAVPVELREDGNSHTLWVSRHPPLDATEVVIVETLARVAEVSMRLARLLEERTDQARELSELVEEREVFLTATAHQLRTPLTAIVGFAHLVNEEAAASADVQDMAAMVMEQAEDMSFQLDNLLIASRAVTDSVLILPEPVDLRAETARVVVAVNNHLPTSVGYSGEAAAQGDPLRVRQILRNLLVNACQHGGPPIEVVIDTEDDEAWVDVVDHGPGLPPDRIEAMFRPFTHADGRSGRPGSTGLGLHVASQLARMMRGDIRYRRDGDRTVFRLALPASGEDRDPTAVDRVGSVD